MDMNREYHQAKENGITFKLQSPPFVQQSSNCLREYAKCAYKQKNENREGITTHAKATILCEDQYEKL